MSLITFSLFSYGLLISKTPVLGLQYSNAYGIHTLIRGNKLTFSEFTPGPLISKTAVLRLQYSNEHVKRAVDARILSHFLQMEWAYVLLIHLGAFDFQKGLYLMEIDGIRAKPVSAP